MVIIFFSALVNSVAVVVNAMPFVLISSILPVKILLNPSSCIVQGQEISSLVYFFLLVEQVRQNGAEIAALKKLLKMHTIKQGWNQYDN